MTEECRPAPREELEQLLGRCVLRIQQYERLMKAILAHHQLAGPTEALDSQRSARVEKFSGQTLGTLVRSLFEDFVVSQGADGERQTDDTTPDDRSSLAFAVRIEMSLDQWRETKGAVDDLVAMRNELIHGFTERFDIRNEAGRAAGVLHLEDCWRRVEQHLLQLTGWAQGLKEARAAAASFAESPTFYEWLVNGIAPDGSFDWSNTGIVRALGEALQECSKDGWTPLADARAWVALNNNEQTPEKYGCRTWPQVVSESKKFDLVYRPAENGRREAWIRAR